MSICSDISPADWIVSSDLPWERLVGFGPGGFERYARVRFLPDPVRPGQPESEADVDAVPDELEQWSAMLELLASETSDPEHCYFGYGTGGESRRPLAVGRGSAFPRLRRPRPARSSCSEGHCLTPNVGGTSTTPKSGVNRSSRWAFCQRSCGHQTTPRASPPMSTRTGQGSERLPRRSSNSPLINAWTRSPPTRPQIIRSTGRRRSNSIDARSLSSRPHSRAWFRIGVIRHSDDERASDSFAASALARVLAAGDETGLRWCP